MEVEGSNAFMPRVSSRVAYTSSRLFCLVCSPSTLSLSHHLATSSSNFHLKMKPPFGHKGGGGVLNEVGKPQRLSGDQK